MANPRTKLAVAAVLALVALASVLTYWFAVRLPPARWNEEAAAMSLILYARAQNQFYKKDFYGKGGPRFANPVDGRGFPDLYRIGGPGSDGRTLDLLHHTIARATSPEHAFRGYYFVEITHGPDGEPWDYATGCGLCAVPKSYGVTGRLTGIINADWSPHWKDNGGKPVTRWPARFDDWFYWHGERVQACFENVMGFPEPWD